MVVPKVAWPVHALLGEGPVWLAKKRALYFVDIRRGCIHAFVPHTGERRTIAVGGAPSFVVPARGGGLLVGSGNAVHALEGDRLGEPVFRIPEPPTNRTNDAAVDEAGRLWFGTMDDGETRPTGAIWCWDGRALHRAGPEATVTNGPAASKGDRWLYHCDSGNRTIWRHPLGPSPVLAGGEVFVRIAPGDGFPDGIAVDAEDCLWVALWDGWCVRRYSPAGQLLAQVDFPCARVTKLALGGPDLVTAYVTTASTGLSAQELERQPMAGSLFAFPAPAPGRPSGLVR